MTYNELNMRQWKQMQFNFRWLREERGWTLGKLAECSGIAENILEDMECGRNFGVEYLLTLCEFYGIHPRDIFLPM